MGFPEMWADFTRLFIAMDKAFFSVMALTPYLVLVAWWVYQRGLARHLQALKNLAAEGPPLPILSFVLRIAVVFAAFVADVIIICFWYGYENEETFVLSSVLSVLFSLLIHTFVVFLLVSSFHVIEHKLSLTNDEMKSMLSTKNPYHNPDTRAQHPLSRLQHFRTTLVYLRQMHRDLCNFSAVPLVLNNVIKLMSFVFMLFYIFAYNENPGFEFVMVMLSCLGNLSALFVLGLVTDAVKKKVRKGSLCDRVKSVHLFYPNIVSIWMLY